MPVRKNLVMNVNDPQRRRGRSKRTWMIIVKIDIKKFNSSKDLTQDRLELRNTIGVFNPNIVEIRL